MRLKGKAIIITGAARGIGLACAREMSREGARLTLWDVDGDALQQAASDLARYGCASINTTTVDVSDVEHVAAALEIAIGKHGCPNALINNAGIVRKGNFLDLDAVDFDTVYRVNLRGYFCVGQAVARRMVKERIEGSIVNMSSVNGQLAIGDQCAYVTMKGGVNQLTKAMALALAPHSIRVNAVAPGSINTELFRAVVADPAAHRTVLSRTPLGRAGEPVEVGQLCTFLVSDESRYITGTVIPIDGGRLALNYTVPVKTA